MLYLQIASPKSSVLNFLDSNSFEVIISIFQRTEKVPDMERLLFYEKNNDIGLRLLDCKRRKALLHSKRPGIKEIASTERLIRLLQDEGGAAGRVPG